MGGAGGQTTVYVGPHYEKNLTTAVVTKYYTLGGQRVAMPVGGALTWIHGDHLGSASLTTYINRITTGEMRYYPYGEARGTSTVPTDRRYTGQREEASTGLYDYNARYYDAALGRFIQADTIVPDPSNPQMLNRYSYTAGNPIRYNDPDGHCGPLCWAGIALGLTGVALTVSASQPLPPERQPSDAQGLLGMGLILSGLGLQAPQWLVPVACGDGNCTNEAASIAQAACGGDCGDEISTAGRAAHSVWEQNPLQRGIEIEEMLGRSPQLSRTFPVIDRFQDGIATSIKSIDLSANSYQDVSALTSKVTGYVNALAKWQGARWGGTLIRGSQITARELLLAIPPGATEAQMTALQELEQWAATVGVTLNISVVP